MTLTDFDDAELHRQYNPLMSPLVWDLAHIGQQEELWLLRDGDPHRPGMLPANIEGLYDAFVHTRASRVDLPLLSPAQSRAYCRSVRAAALELLDALPDRDDDAEVAFRFGLVISHENQHDETMLQALNLRSGAPILGAAERPARRSARRWPAPRCWCPAGRSSSGVDAPNEPLSLDNERPAHVVDVPAFRIGRVPVTNAEWRQFVDDGGYTQQRWWSPRGWEHRVQADLSAPEFWNPRRHPDPVRPRRGDPRRRTRPARQRSSKPRPTRRGRVPGCPPRWSGRRPRLGSRCRCSRRRYPWGSEEPTARQRQSRR